MSRRGAFLVLEGIDGSGTTTQSEALRLLLEGEGIPAVVTREPTSGPVGKLLRQALTKQLAEDGAPVELDWTTLALLFAADRMDHVRREIEPAVASGQVVICDRYDLSSLIYQSETSPHPEETLDWVRALNRQAMRPDLVLVLAIDPDIAEARRRARGGPEELFERRELQRRLAARYREAPKVVGEEGVVLVEGDEPAQALSQRLLGLIRQRLPGLFVPNLPPTDN